MSDCRQGSLSNQSSCGKFSDMLLGLPLQELCRPVEKSDIKAILVGMLLDFSERLVQTALEELEQLLSRFGRRRHPRFKCILEVEYVVEGRRCRGKICDLSKGGAFLQGENSTRTGQEISLTPLDSWDERGAAVVGRVVRTTPQGVGVQFNADIRVERKLHSCSFAFEDEEPAQTTKEEKEMARFRKRRIRWTPSSAHDVAGYKLYWALGGGVNYDSDFAEVGQVTEVILPDDVLAFPLVEGDIELGVTAVNHAGNESDMTKFSAHFDFTAPEAPTDLVVETI